MNLDELSIIRPATEATLARLQRLGARVEAEGNGTTFADWCADGCDRDAVATLQARWAVLTFAGRRMLIVLAQPP